MKTVKDKEENIRVATEKIERLAKEGCDLICLPEMFNCPYQTDVFKDYAEVEGGESFTALQEVAKRNSIYLVGGTMPEECGEAIYNTSYVFDRKGELIAKHRKMHLFEVQIKGGQHFREADTLSAGNEVTVFDTEFGKIGLCICFDLRFIELARLMVNEGAKMFIVPAAFNLTTGPMHWELMFRGRAVDNQVYAVGVAPARDMSASYHSYGNSLVVSPWGEVIERLGSEEGTIVCEVDLALCDDVREQLPLLKNRRNDLYDMIKK